MKANSRHFVGAVALATLCVVGTACSKQDAPTSPGPGPGPSAGRATTGRRYPDTSSGLWSRPVSGHRGDDFYLATFPTSPTASAT